MKNLLIIPLAIACTAAVSNPPPTNNPPGKLPTDIVFRVEVLSSSKPTGPWQHYTNVVFAASSGAAPQMFFRAGLVTSIQAK